MRGKVEARVQHRDDPGITPACAGKSAFSLLITGQPKGSPPRVRGKVVHVLIRKGNTGITPACAGKSQVPNLEITRSRDHPRVCGEKFTRKSAINCGSGSPPRVRGKVQCKYWRAPSDGITPACAGKRKQRQNREESKKDHPRVCGEKSPEGGGLNLILGSPPRVRGKARQAVYKDIKHGITPACAGKRNSLNISPQYN